MRIFKIVFGLLLLIGVIGVSSWKIKERIVLEVAGWKLGQDFERTARQLKTVSANDSSCALGIIVGQDEVMGVQLKFVDETNYQAELVCRDGISTGTVLFTGELWGGVKRGSGSGIIFKFEEMESKEAWVLLEYASKRIGVGYVDDKVVKIWNMDEMLSGGAGAAIANCRNWGFSCCKSGTEVGQGAQVSTSDCRNDCYQQCNQYPVVLFFNSDPLVDPQSRTLYLSGNRNEVRFGFEVADYDDGIKSVRLSYGDGDEDTQLQAKEDEISHEFICDKGRCDYEVRLEAEDINGNQLPTSKQSLIKLVVQP